MTMRMKNEVEMDPLREAQRPNKMNDIQMI